MAEAFEIDVAMRGKVPGGRPDRAIAALANRQHGMVARRQLLAMRLSPSAIDRRVTWGWLHVVHRGVYAVGHTVLSSDARYMGAVLLGGPGAALSHRSAAALWGIRMSSRPRPEVTIPTARRQPRAVQLHFARLPADEVTEIRRIPVTAIARALFDLAAAVPRAQAERAFHEAERKRLSGALSVRDVLERHPHCRAAPVVRAILESLDIGATENDFEDAFVDFVRRYHLPMPEANVWLPLPRRSVRVDFLWRAAREIVELDGRESHGTALAFESDRARDRALRVAGWHVTRVTWRQLKEEPDQLAADLRALLAAAPLAA
jgi:very-short-patch-repair endonuclease/predicted transcriptional regulator of viral defense system